MGASLPDRLLWVPVLNMAFLVPSLGNEGGRASRRQIIMAVCILTLATVGK